MCLCYSCDFVIVDLFSQGLCYGSVMFIWLLVIEDGVILLYLFGQFSVVGMMWVKVQEELVNIYIVWLCLDLDELDVCCYQISDLMIWIGVIFDGLFLLIVGDFFVEVGELVCSMFGFQLVWKNLGECVDLLLMVGVVCGYGLDVLFQVKYFDGLCQENVKLLVVEGEIGVLCLGVMVILCLQGEMLQCFLLK